MFIKRVKHYHQWLRIAIPLKTKLGQIPSDSIRIQGPSKRPSSGRLYPVSPVKERNRKGGKCKISQVLQSPVSSPQTSPKVEASNRLKQAQHFSTHRKVQNRNSSVHQDLPDSRGMGIVDRPLRRLPSHPHPSKLKEIPKVLPIPGRLADQVSVPGGSPLVNTQDSGRSHPVLGMDLKPREIRTETNSGVLVRGLRIPPRFSPCKTHSREMAQTSGFDPASQVKTCFDCKMFDVTNWVACLNRENGPGGTPSHEALSVSSQGALEISSVAGQPPSLDRNNFCTRRLVAEPLKRDDRCRPSSQRSQHPTLYIRLKHTLGRSLIPKFYKGSVVRCGKRTTHKCSRVEGGLSGPSKLQGPVSEPNSASCNGQLNSGSLHKLNKEELSGDVRTPVEDHDMVPSLSHNIESQTHPRVSECDGRPSVQVEPSTVNRMVAASAGVQTDLSKSGSHLM